MPRTKEQNIIVRAEKKQLIMDSALLLFAENGYDRTSIGSIAQHAEMSQGLLYTYFKNKDDLLYQILVSGGEKISGNLFTKRMTFKSFPDDFEKILDRITDNNDFFKLYTALSLQPKVIQKFGTLVDKHYSLHKVANLFRKRFGEQAMKELTLFSIMIKGYSMLALYSDRQHAIPVDMLKKTIIDFIRERYTLARSKKR
jgi:AcrR family transcriptional regulator